MKSLECLSIFIRLPECSPDHLQSAVKKLCYRLNNILECFWGDLCSGLPSLESVFISKGNVAPGMHEIRPLLSCLRPLFLEHTECTLETESDSIGRLSAETLYSLGVNRISLKESHKNQWPASWVKDWPGHLNLDAAAAKPLPSGLLAQFNHLSLYGSASPGKLELHREYLENVGFQQYELCHFARQGQQSLQVRNLYNMRPLLGIGPGAESTLHLQQPSGKVQTLRIIEEKDNAKWLNSSAYRAEQIVLNPAQLMLEYFMMGLRLCNGLDVFKFKELFGKRPEQCIARTVAKWVPLGQMECSSCFLRMSRQGLFRLDSVMGDIAMELSGKPWKISQVTTEKAMRVDSGHVPC